MPSKRLVYTREQMTRIWKATQDFERSKSGRPVDNIEAVETPIHFLNDSAYTIPAFGLMQPTTTVTVDGSYTLVKVKRPIDSTLMRCPLLINGPTEVLTAEYGMAQPGPVYWLLHDGAHTYAAGDRLGSLTATFTATYGSLYAVLGADDEIGTNVVKCMFDTSTMFGKTKAGGLNVGTPANVLVYDAAGTLTAKEHLAETRQSNIAGSTEIVLLSSYGRWLALGLC